MSKTSYYLMIIVLPFLMLEVTWWHFLIGFLTVHLTSGLILGVIFQLAHVVEPTEHLQEEQAKSLSVLLPRGAALGQPFGTIGKRICQLIRNA
jgi:hypothetical protein